ncbi:MAG: outer membrane beta-barrel protein, partial [Ferruginibacter sp.]
YNYSVGVALSSSHFVQDNRTKVILRKYNFNNFFPTASLYIKLKGYAGIRFNYNGSSRAPSLDQLQPITDNTNQINQYIGNPDLKQSFTHSINMNYNFYNVLQEKGLWMGVYGSLTQNAFVNDVTLYSGGKSTYRTVNADGNYYFNLYSNYNFKWKKPNIRISFGPNANVSRNISFLNAQKSVNTNSSYGFSFGISKEKENKYEVSLSPDMSWVRSKSSINNSANANYWQAGIRANVGLTLPKKFRFETDFNFKAKQNDPRFPAKNNYSLWNASLKRFILKEILEASVSVNDILNENRGYDRNFSNNQYTETYYNTLKRYWMVTLTWNFSKNGKPSSGF